MEPTQAAEPKKSKMMTVSTFVTVIVGMILRASADIAGYWYGAKSESKASGDTAQQAQSPRTEEGVAFHTVLASSVVGVDQPATKEDNPTKQRVTVGFSIPQASQAVSVMVTPTDMGGLADVLATSSDSVVARWLVGRPGKELPSNDQVVVTAITPTWLQQTDDKSSKLLFESDTSTPAAKKTFIDALKSDTEACSKVDGKGVVTTKGSDAFKVCYEIMPFKESFDPVLRIRGYMEANSVPYVLYGYVHLDAKDYSGDTQVAANARKQNYPADVAQSRDRWATALANSYVTVKNAN